MLVRKERDRKIGMWEEEARRRREWCRCKGNMLSEWAERMRWRVIT